MANFLKAVRSRRHEDLTCDIAEAYMANISCRIGRALAFDAAGLQLRRRPYRAPDVVPDRV